MKHLNYTSIETGNVGHKKLDRAAMEQGAILHRHLSPGATRVVLSGGIWDTVEVVYDISQPAGRAWAIARLNRGLLFVTAAAWTRAGQGMAVREIREVQDRAGLMIRGGARDGELIEPYLPDPLPNRFPWVGVYRGRAASGETILLHSIFGENIEARRLADLGGAGALHLGVALLLAAADGIAPSGPVAG